MDLASFALDLAAGGIGGLVAALVATWWQRTHPQKPVWKNEEGVDAPALHLEE